MHMRLLSAEKVETTQNRQDAARRSRIAKANQEETAAIARMNLALQKEREVYERHERDPVMYEAELNVKKSILELEVDSLEERKKEAMKPVGDALQRVETIENELIEESKQLKTLRENIANKQEELAIRTEKLLDEEQILVEDKKKLDLRELAIASAEKEVSRSTNELANKWVEYHSSVHIHNEQLEKREREVRDALKTIETRREKQDLRDIEQNERDRQLRDRSATLEQTAAEVRAMQP